MANMSSMTRRLLLKSGFYSYSETLPPPAVSNLSLAGILSGECVLLLLLYVGLKTCVPHLFWDNKALEA